ncbi:hypothetical protein [Blastococcus sp. SYSU DS0973]
MTKTTMTPAEESRYKLAQAQAAKADAVALHDQHQTAAEELHSFLTNGRASLFDFLTYRAQWRRLPTP